MMGGIVTLESELGQGSIFTFIFPELSLGNDTTELPEHSSPDDDLNQFAPCTILVVDDVDSNRQLIQGYFAQTHHLLIMAEDGEEAIRLTQIHQPDLILLDLRMPRMNGCETALHLKNDARTQHIPIIILTASCQKEEQLEVETICQGFLRKPVSRSALVTEMKKHLQFFAPIGEKYQHAPLPSAEDSPLQSNNSSKVSFTTPINLGELLTKIRQEEEMVWTTLRKTLEMRELQQFIAHLEVWSQEHQCQILADYVSSLKTQLDAFDWQLLPQTIEKFPSIRQQIAGDSC